MALLIGVLSITVSQPPAMNFSQYGGFQEYFSVVPFMTAGNLPYLITGEHAPWISTDDVTDPVREVEYRLEFLPHTDAFYSFQGYLGARRWLPGRTGPPGADYNTLPR